jgi:GT2 family glycosyltransferase
MDSPSPATVQPLVSVIVPVLTTRGLDLCLGALADQTYPNFEVVIADNGAPGGLERFAALDPRFRVVLEPRRGSYRARNRGVQAAKGAVFAFTDADCVPAPDWIERGVAALQAHPGAFVGGKIEVTVADPGRPTLAELYELRTSFRQRDYVERWGFAATANLFTPRSLFEEVGPFDGELFSMGDREWGSRASAAGHRPVFGADVRIAHPARETLRQLGGRAQRTTGGFLGLIGRKRWTLGSVVRDVPMGLLPTGSKEELSEVRAPLTPRQRAGLLSVSAFLLAVRAAETVRLLAGGTPVSR